MAAGRRWGSTGRLQPPLPSGEPGGTDAGGRRQASYTVVRMYSAWLAPLYSSVYFHRFSMFSCLLSLPCKSMFTVVYGRRCRSLARDIPDSGIVWPTFLLFSAGFCLRPG
jgi:hypothetical protein